MKRKLFTVLVLAAVFEVLVASSAHSTIIFDGGAPLAVTQNSPPSGPNIAGGYPAGYYPPFPDYLPGYPGYIGADDFVLQRRSILSRVNIYAWHTLDMGGLRYAWDGTVKYTIYSDIVAGGSALENVLVSGSGANVSTQYIYTSDAGETLYLLQYSFGLPSPVYLQANETYWLV